MSWDPFWSLLGGSWGVLGSSGKSSGGPTVSLGVSWGSLGWPLRLLEGLLAVLGVSRKSLGLSWKRFWGVRAAKRYQHDAKMDIQSSTALKKARFPFYECTGLFGHSFSLFFFRSVFCFMCEGFLMIFRCAFGCIL